MTAPTAPTAPLPTTVHIAVEYFDQRLLAGAPLSHWETIREHLLTMQRERDEALAKLCDPGTTHYEGCHTDGQKHWRCALEKLAASERTCAEWKQLAHFQEQTIDKNIPILEAACKERESLIARAEAAERAVEGLK